MKESNTNGVFKTMGASNHTKNDRQAEDFYATDPKATEMLLELEKFNAHVWEPAAGEGHIGKVLEDAGYIVKATDLIDRGYGAGNVDFLAINKEIFSEQMEQWEGDIVTNPPYGLAQPFIEQSLSLVPKGYKVAMFLKLQFLEGKGRKALFINNPPKTVYVSSSRLLCAKNGDFEGSKEEIGSSAIAYAWFVWVKGFKGTSQLKWFN